MTDKEVCDAPTPIVTSPSTNFVYPVGDGICATKSCGISRNRGGVHLMAL